MRELELEEWLRISNHLTGMTEVVNKIIRGKTVGPESIAGFQKLIFEEALKELQEFTIEDVKNDG